nr:protein tamozhennic [Leptinotarsa decemlineata]XP_023025968.1 protein tamozhennic [Leptinotarsa decemlineata]
MVIMENYRLAQNSFRELWQEIEKCHLSYLEMEEIPEKIDQRMKLEEYIQEFLCIAGNNQKFTFTETEDVLERSVISKKDFSGYKASTGFNAIQLYAGNLLSQPWRKEYRQIKTYCGFYKHQIEANLYGAEKLFQAMGYKLYSDRLLVLDGPICPDRVKTVSKDCLVAYVECQIWKLIWEELSTSYKATWYEVHEFRKNHACSPEQAVKALKYKQHQRQYQDHARGFHQGYDALPAIRTQPIPVANMAPTAILNHSFPPVNNHLHLGLPSAPEFQFAGGCCSNYPAFSPSYGYVAYADASPRPSLSTNGYYNGFVAPQPSPQYTVPTAKLIEVESQMASSQQAVTLDRPAHKSRHSEYINNESYKTRNNNENFRNNFADEASDKNGSQFEDWEYVYRNLESQGYSKDLGERGDVLSPNSARSAKESKKIKATNLDEALNNLSFNERTKYSDVLKRGDGEKSRNVEVGKVEKRTSPSSSYDNLSPAQTKKPAQKSNSIAEYVKTKTLPREKATTSADKPSNSRNLDSIKVKEDKIKKKTTAGSKAEDDRWHCKACTFLNGTEKDICEMCGKTRFAALEQPMEVGGAECSKCTLVNPKSKTTCDACGASLLGSPTYI